LPDIVTTIIGVLLTLTLGAAVEYYRIVRRARKEYEKARTALEDVILSFDRQLQREADESDATAYKLDAMVSKTDGNVHRLDSLEKNARTIESKLDSVLQTEGDRSASVEDLDRKVEALVSSQSALTNRFSGIEEKTNRLLAVPEASIQAAIPIRRDKALAQLTETELSVLEMLASEGSKTAPEIKDRVKLSREHTARLMKKLYEGGYLERDTNKIPFRYSVKKEMEAILKKNENAAT
jgi:DNA-binding CsgD family transcriptional regulator/type II secretory pathway pseudopilin PulG